MNNFEPNRLIRYDVESIINELRFVYKKFFINKIMYKKDFDQYSKKIHSSTVSHHFGSWQNALFKANLPYGRNTRIPVTELLSELKRIKEFRNNLYFSFATYKRSGGKHTEKTILRGLGSPTWPELLNQQFGIKHEKKDNLFLKISSPKRKKYTQDILLNELKNVWDNLGRRPTYSEFKNTSKIGIKIYERRFGTWIKAIETFCHTHKNYSSGSIVKNFKTSKKLLIQELQELKERHSLTVFEQDDYKKYGGKYSIQTYHNHFGSWKAALHSVGLKCGRDIPTEEEFFDELQRIWEILGKQPSLKQMNKMSKYSTKQFLKAKYNGKWMQFIYAFSNDRLTKDDNSINENRIPLTSEIHSDKNILINKSESPNLGDDGQVKIRTARFPTLRLRFRVFQRDHFSCVLCGRSPAKNPSIILHVDHIIAYTKGGETILDNLQTLCEECNFGKSNLDLKN
jgi:hypothetical protein